MTIICCSWNSFQIQRHLLSFLCCLYFIDPWNIHVVHSGVLRRRGLLATNFILQELHKELQQEQNFFVCQDRNLKFSESLWLRILWTVTIFHLSIVTNKKVLLLKKLQELHNFVMFHKIPNHKDSENFKFLSWQTKKFCS